MEQRRIPRIYSGALRNPTSRFNSPQQVTSRDCRSLQPAISCSDPRYRSVIWIEECPSRNLICSRSPPLFLHSFAQVRLRSCAPKHSIPSCFADCSTTDQPAPSLNSFRLFRPSRSSAAATPLQFRPACQALMPCLTQTRTGTLRMRLPFPSRSARTHRPSRSGMVSTSSEASFCRRNAQPTGYREPAVGAAVGPPRARHP